MKDARVQVMGIDAGGTMTDTFFVKENGSFVVGKAQSNPEDESLAIYNSSQDALSHWKSDISKVYPELVTCVYSGTAMLNRVVQRRGMEVGLICNKGFECDFRRSQQQTAIARIRLQGLWCGGESE